MKKLNWVNKLSKGFIIFGILLANLAFISQEIYAQNNKLKINTICLDAGHGGKDPGCHGQYSYEKDITLAVCLKVEQILKQQVPTMKVVQTRTEDIFWELPLRGKIANDNKADLFISIHVNSTPKRNGTRIGTETYVLGLGREDEKENAIADKGESFEEGGELLNTNDPLTQIMIAQYTQAFLAQSINLGAKVEQEFAIQGRASMGVKQKSLNVLANSGMPGVLIEIGFLNNKEEENYLNSESGQAQIAEAIVKAIKSYKDDVEKIALKN